MSYDKKFTGQMFNLDYVSKTASSPFAIDEQKWGFSLGHK